MTKTKAALLAMRDLKSRTHAELGALLSHPLTVSQLSYMVTSGYLEVQPVQYRLTAAGAVQADRVPKPRSRITAESNERRRIKQLENALKQEQKRHKKALQARLKRAKAKRLSVEAMVQQVRQETNSVFALGRM